MKRKKCFVIFLFYFLFCIQNAYATFFDICNIKNNDLKNLKYVLNNSNSRFIPHEIDNISNEIFQQSLYLISFYKDDTNFPEEMIDVIGFNIVKQIPKFKRHVINYTLKKYQNQFYKLSKELNNIQLDNYDILMILKNVYFQPNEENATFINNFLKIVFYETMLSYNDVSFLIDKYEDKITDIMLLQQIRFRLWNKKTENIDKILKFIKNESFSNKVISLKQFNKKINKKNEIIIKLKNGQTKKQYKSLTKEQIIKICVPLIGKDEYIDLICLNNGLKNKNDVFKILNNNLNPIFYPDKWLQYRLSFVRNEINTEQEINEDVYNIIANSGVLYKNDLYTQQFLSGLIAYLRKDYENAVLHFTKCAKNSQFSDYNAKAYYWLGLSYKKLGSNEFANDAFNNAKIHILTMYGQLGATEINEDPEQNIAEYISSIQENQQLLCNDINFIVSYLDQYKKNNRSLSQLLINYIEDNNDNKNSLFNALNIIKNDFDEHIAKAFSLHVLKYDIIDHDISFPDVDEDSLINAVIKKESNFSNKAVSNKGARGMMQIMPSTGRVLAKQMGIRYDHKKLLSDKTYNVNMGKFYLENLLKRFDNNKLLSLASYNAGGLNVEKWINTNGDPRDMKTNEEIVEWIEKIPFSQTRDYVVKILGFEMVYDVLKNLNTYESTPQNDKNAEYTVTNEEIQTLMN